MISKHQVTLEEIYTIVKNNDKQRFSIKRGTEIPSISGNYGSRAFLNMSFIRANQGHSFKLKAHDLKKITIDDLQQGKYPIVLHGTYKKFLPLIKKTGLNKMNRTHIHMAQGKFGEVTSGVRKSVEVLIYIDIHKAMTEGGLEFFISQNGVILCEGPIPSKFFSKIVDN